jgi:hypothetical protein
MAEKSGFWNGLARAFPRLGWFVARGVCPRFDAGGRALRRIEKSFCYVTLLRAFPSRCSSDLVQQKSLARLGLQLAEGPKSPS